VERIKNFASILGEEVEESADIIEKYESLKNKNGELSKEDRLEVLTDMSDWLGDIVVYCASEARRWGLPLNDILEVIMQSNFSKLDEKGLPIYDDRGKVLKGPNYWKPEPKIKELLK
jgi:predicted HAD superfamily Cof-like phosphohydrolase